MGNNKDFRKSFNKALKTEKELLKYYNNYFIKHNTKLQKLYNSHINNLKDIDGTISGLNSMSKLFQENIPNAMKKKNISKENINNYLNNNNMKLKEYVFHSNTNKFDFLEQHIKNQLILCMGEIFEIGNKLLDNIKYMHILFMNKDDDNANTNTKEVYVDLIKNKEKANIINRRNLIIKLVFELKDERYIGTNIPHKNDLKIIKKETYNLVKNLIISTVSIENKMSVKEHLKKQDKIVKSMIFEEQKKQLEEQLQNIEKEKDNKKVLLNIVKRISQTSDTKLDDDPYYRQEKQYNTRNNNRRLNNTNNNYINRKATQVITRPLSQEKNENNNNNLVFNINTPYKTNNNIENNTELLKFANSSNSNKLKRSRHSKKLINSKKSRKATLKKSRK